MSQDSTQPDKEDPATPESIPEPYPEHATEQRPTEPPQACANCGSDLSGHFCAICGQPNSEVKRPFWYLLRDMLHVLLDLDGRAYRSLFLLTTRPAYLTRAYVSGQRFRYTPPLRLFLAISIIFFVVVTVQNSLQTLTGSLADIESGQVETSSTVQAGADLVVPGSTAQQVDARELEADLEEIYSLIDRINLPLASEQTNANLHSFMRMQARDNFETLVEDPAGTLAGLLEYITVFMLVMMPLLALIQKIFFLPAKRYYIEHLVLTLHNNAFVIFIFLLQTLLGMVVSLEIPALSTVADWLSSILLLWLPPYLLLSLKFFFGWGWFSTVLLFLLISLCYAVSMGTGIVLLGLTLFLLF